MAADSIGIVAAAKAPDGVTHGIGIDVFDILPLFCVIDQFSDLGVPPVVIALGMGIVFKDILVELHFVFVGHDECAGHDIDDMLKEFLCGVCLLRCDAFSDLYNHVAVDDLQNLFDVAEAVVGDTVGDLHCLQDLSHGQRAGTLGRGELLCDLDDLLGHFVTDAVIIFGICLSGIGIIQRFTALCLILNTRCSCVGKPKTWFQHTVC